MSKQKYRDLSLVFGVPSGERYEMLSGISNKVQNHFQKFTLNF